MNTFNSKWALVRQTAGRDCRDGNHRMKIVYARVQLFSQTYVWIFSAKKFAWALKKPALIVVIEVL